MDGGAGLSSLTPAILRFFYLKQVTSYATASSMVLVLHDYFATLGQEVELVWFTPWSLPKIVYLLNRYLTLLMAYMYILVLFFGARTPMRCFALGVLSGWYSWISTVLIQLVLQIWLYAVYRGNRRWMYPLSVIYVVLAGVVCGTLMPFGSQIHFIVSNPVCVDVIKGIQITPSFWANIDVTTSTKYPTYMLGITLCWSMLTVCLLALISFKVATTYRNHSRDDHGLAFVLLRDSMLNFCVLLVVVLANIFMVALTPYALYQVGLGFNVALPSVLSSRILINLRAWEKCREDRVNANGVPLEQWETIFRVNVTS